MSEIPSMEPMTLADVDARMGEAISRALRRLAAADDEEKCRLLRAAAARHPEAAQELETLTQGGVYLSGVADVLTRSPWAHRLTGLVAAVP